MQQYADYFMNFFNSDESNIENKMLRFRYKKMKHFFDNLESYEKKVDIIKDINELIKYISEYWMNYHTEEQDRSELPKLGHTRNYYFGNEVWGLIHDVYGREKVFYTLRHLKEFPAIFNGALKEIGREDLCI